MCPGFINGLLFQISPKPSELLSGSSGPERAKGPIHGECLSEGRVRMEDCLPSPCQDVVSTFGLSPKNTIRNSGKSSSVNGLNSPCAFKFRSSNVVGVSDRVREEERLNLDSLVDRILKRGPPLDLFRTSSLTPFWMITSVGPTGPLIELWSLTRGA